MKIINFDLIQILNLLKGLMNKKLPQRIGYAISKNIMTLDNEYDLYEKELKKILDSYQDYYIKDDKDNPVMLPTGLPELSSTEQQEKMLSEVNELLNLQIKVDFYYVPEECFDYDDAGGRYDVLSVKELLNLQTVLCKKEEEEEK